MVLSGEFLNWKQAQQLPQKDKKRKKRKGSKKKKLKNKNTKDVGHFLVQNFDFCTCPSKNVIKCDASGKMGMLSCCAFLSRLELA